LDLKIAGKAAIVTGGGSGIGRAIAVRLAREGAAVVIADLNGESAEGVSSEVASRGMRSMALQADATREDDVERTVRRTIEAYGTIDILVNNAGGGTNLTFISNYPVADWDRTIEINLKSTFLFSRAVAGGMMERRRGRIINISSISGKLGESLIGPYCAAKFGVLGLTQVLAKELGRYSITVNAVCPGYVYTPAWEQLAQRMKETVSSLADKSLEEIFENRARSHTALQRAQTAEEIASLVAYLASEEAGSITGQAINVDGGAVMG
jgi:NAD(P)-dependent dehydrogenase (short-subunit alcohol dehydrogenase family)